MIISIMSDAPPQDSELEGPPDITDNISRQYPETPMPNHFGEDDESETDSEPSAESSFFSSSLKIVYIAIAITHLWTVWTMRTDMNILMQFLREITQQNKHITDLLHNQHQVKWQIVPTQL